MTIEIAAHAASGMTIHKYTASDVTDAALYMTRQSAARFVDGYAVGGFGIVRIADRGRTFTYLGTDTGGAPAFMECDAPTLTEVMRRALYTLRKSEPRTV